MNLKKMLIALIVLPLLVCSLVYADYVEVRKAANVYVEPDRTSDTAFRAEVGTNLHIIESETKNGYYHVEDLSTGSQGWIYRSLVRRFPGDIPQPSGTAGKKSTLGIPFPLNRCKAPYNEEPQKGLAIESCGLQGDSDDGSAEAVQNPRKNDLCITGTVEPITILDLVKLQQEVDDSGLVYGSRFRGKGPPMNRSPLTKLPPLPNSLQLGEGSLVSFIGYMAEAHYMPKSQSKGDKKGGESVNCHKTQHEMADIHVALSAKKGRISPKDPNHVEQFCKTISAEFIPHLRPAVWDVPTLDQVIELERPVRVTGPLFFDGSHEPCRNGEAGKGDPQRITVWEIHPIYAFEVCKFDDIKKCTSLNKSAWQPISSASGVNLEDDEEE